MSFRVVTGPLMKRPVRKRCGVGGYAPRVPSAGASDEAALNDQEKVPGRACARDCRPHTKRIELGEDRALSFSPAM
jgi:hypothetical protein